MKKILVIDDNTGIRENTAEILTLAGYKTSTAENGKIGVELAIREIPDLIVCDIMMPELDGYGVLHLLKKKSCHGTNSLHIPDSKNRKNGFQKRHGNGRRRLYH